MIFSAGLSIALFISALLLVKQDKTIPDWILFCWMLLNAAYISFFNLLESGKIYDYPALLGLQFPIPLLQGVMLYFYVSTVTGQSPKNKKLLFLHFIPSLLAFGYLIPFLFSSSENKIEVFENQGQGYETFLSILVLGIFISGIVYVVWSSILLSRHKKRIRNQFSGLENINLRWLQLLTYGLGVVWSLVIFTRDDTIILIGVSVFVILIGFFGLRQKEIFKSKMEQDVLLPIQQTTAIIDNKDLVGHSEYVSNKEETVKQKYLSSGLTNSTAEKLHQKLNLLMEEEKIYKNSNLSLADLAQALDTHPNYISQILNEKEQLSFYDFVNTHRVEEFKRLIMIQGNKNLTLLAIAFDCGFNSKSSFNRFFKKSTGITPSQFVKEQKIKA